MLMSLRGSACLYQGEELGLPQAEVPFERLQDPYGITFWPEYKGRDGCRTPMPWSDADHGGLGTSRSGARRLGAAARGPPVIVEQSPPQSLRG